MPRTLTLVLALLAGAAFAASTGCASTAREAARGSTGGAVEGLREDPTFARLHDDLGRDPTLPGVGRRLTDGVVTSVAAALPSIEQVVDRVVDRTADRIALAARRHAGGADPLAALDRFLRGLARDGLSRAEALIADAIERARAAPVRQWAEELGAAFARGAMREVTAAVSTEVGRGIDAAIARAASVSVTPAMLDRFHAELEAIALHMSRGTYKELQNQVQSDRNWPWVVGFGAGALVLLLLLRAQREILALRRLAEAVAAKETARDERDAEAAKREAARTKSA